MNPVVSPSNPIPKTQKLHIMHASQPCIYTGEARQPDINRPQKEIREKKEI
jgi:hypothetical protein